MCIYTYTRILYVYRMRYINILSYMEISVFGTEIVALCRHSLGGALAQDLGAQLWQVATDPAQKKGSNVIMITTIPEGPDPSV